MKDLRLDTSTHDLVFTNGDLSFVEQDEYVAQKLKIRFQFFWQEWFYDQRLGIPYFRDVFVSNPDIDLITALYRKTIVTTPYVESLTSISVTINRNLRQLYLNFVARTDFGGEVSGDPFILDF